MSKSSATDERGFTTAFVALLLMSILFVMAYLIDVTGILLRKQEFQTMAELGAAAGGRVVAERIAELADAHYEREELSQEPPPDKKHPEQYLAPEDRAYLQNNRAFIDEVKKAADDFADYNRPGALADAEVAVTVVYPFPKGENNCTDASKKTLDIKVEVEYDRPFILGKLARQAGQGDTIKVREEGLYRVNLCP